MGRKSSEKQLRTGASDQGSGPNGQGRSAASKFLLIAALVVAIGGGSYVIWGRGGADAAAADAAKQAAAKPDPTQMAANEVFAKKMAALGPHKQAQYPPMPTQEFAPPRPVAVVNAAFQFAADHPEVASYIPCFCGCQQGGHRGNEDCFVKTRAANGDVTEWEPHGLECAVCIDVATRARQMTASGASVAQIREAVEKEFKPNFPTETPTPQPPSH
ncbi:MAG TPA: PCYCGC motif-containing (lipo)protein [Vicinamibacterales bacterium]|jgi:hypothetical protein|nr:PCYCGC motif-containing (lipo)protein [Vicinamibacterales bacterium]